MTMAISTIGKETVSIVFSINWIGILEEKNAMMNDGDTEPLDNNTSLFP
jgi:hypothetical protein